MTIKYWTRRGWTRNVAVVVVLTLVAAMPTLVHAASSTDALAPVVRLPEGERLADTELGQVQGKWAAVAATAAVAFAAFAASNWDEPKDADWYVRGATAAASAALLSATGAALVSAVASQGAKFAVLSYTGAKQVMINKSLDHDESDYE